MNSILTSKWTKVACISALPACRSGFWSGGECITSLTANPIEFVTHTTGDWMLRFLVITLAITPLRKILHLASADPLPAHAGTVCVFLCLPALHHLDWARQVLRLAEMWKDVLKRPFITVGFAGFVLLIPLAVTSTAGWIRRLGGKRWQLLHRADLSDRRPGRDSLLLAGEIRRAQAARVRFYCRGFAGLEVGRLDVPPQAASVEGRVGRKETASAKCSQLTAPRKRAVF